MPTVLVTGASRGIGRATTQRLADAGWTVLAGVRTEADADAVRGPNIRPLELDVVDAEQVAALARLDEPLDAVVNNAGVVVAGPIEALAASELRRQLDVNVVGHVAVTQAVLPLLRQSRGRVVFISSISGRVASPFMGAYAASKFAIEALADALRVEVKPWGIEVVLIEPGSIDTDLWRNASDTVGEVEASLSAEHRELYGPQVAAMRKVVGKIAKSAAPVDTVSAAVERALTVDKPRARYLVGKDAHAQALLSSVVPTRLLDGMMGRLSAGR